MRQMQLMQRTYWMGLIFMAVLCFLPFRPAAAAAPVSLRVTGGEVRDVLLSLARLSGANLIVDDSVTGKITLAVEALDWEEALRLVVRMKGLEYDRLGEVFIVGARGTVGRNFGSLHVFKLQFADPQQAVEAAALVLGGNEAAIPGAAAKAEPSADGQLQTMNRENWRSQRLAIDPATNAVLFYGMDAEAAAIRTLLAEIDVPYRQVSLEAKVVALSKEAAKNLGVEWEWSKFPQTPERMTEYETVTTTVMVEGKPQTITEHKPKDTVTRNYKNGEGIPGIISFGRDPDGHPFELYYAARLNALVADGKASILAKPNVMTLSGHEAVINIGGEIPVPTASTTNATTTTSFVYHEAGIILRYTPRVSEDGLITASVHTEVSSPEYIAELKAYRFYKRSADTMVRLKDGETMVIGGLIGSEERGAVSRIPILGDLPILGQLFRNSSSSKTESEVMIFLTAHIVK